MMKFSTNYDSVPSIDPHNGKCFNVSPLREQYNLNG